MNFKSTSANYYNLIAKDYDKIFTDNISEAENLIVKKDLAAMLKSSSKLTILDLGCGTGLGYELLSKIAKEKEFKFEYVGIDISQQMITQANQKFNSTNVKFYVADIDHLNGLLKNQKFDLIISLFGSFSHFMNYEIVLNNLLNIYLSENGKAYLMTYSRISLKNLYSSVSNWTCKYLERKQNYNIRNSKLSISCPAIFYTPRYMRSIINNTTNYNISFKTINAIFEIGFLKNIAKKLPLSFVCFLFEIERSILYFTPMFGHSLITVIRKKIV